jgi:hypothetical protein
MKNLCITSLAASLLVATPAFAQHLKFEGLSLGLNLNFPSTTVDYSVGGISGNKSNATNDGSVQAAYSYRGQEGYVVGLGATYSPGEPKAGTVTLGSVDYDWKGKDLYSLYIEPGFVVSNTTLAYGKLSYQAANGEIKLSSGQTAKDDYAGYGFGVGLRTMLNTNIYLQAEIMQINYNEKTTLGLTAKPSSTQGSFGVGYQF